MAEPQQQGSAAAGAADAIDFPSLAWFERLAAMMNDNRARQEKLGYVDCVAGFSVAGTEALTVQVSFDEFEAVDVRVVDASEASRADFTLEAELETWQAMIESIAAGNGRPALDQTLNRLSHTGTPLRLSSDDPLRRDMYFRFNQSLQEFFNASASFETSFPSS